MKWLALTLSVLFSISIQASDDVKVGDKFRLQMYEGTVTRIHNGKVYVEMDQQVDPRNGKLKKIAVIKRRFDEWGFDSDATILRPSKDAKGNQIGDKLLVKDNYPDYRRGQFYVKAVQYEGTVLETFENGLARVEYSEYQEFYSVGGSQVQKLPESNIKLVDLDDLEVKNMTPVSAETLVDDFKTGDDVLCYDSRGNEFGGKIKELFKSGDAKVEFTFRYVNDVEQQMNPQLVHISLEDCGGSARDLRIAQRKEAEEAAGNITEANRADGKDVKINSGEQSGSDQVKTK